MEAYQEKPDDPSDYRGSRSIGGRAAWRRKMMGQKLQLT